MNMYTEKWEITYLREVFARNRKAFINYASIILEDRRTWDGEGMDVNVLMVKNEVKRLLKEHEKETTGVTIQ